MTCSAEASGRLPLKLVLGWAAGSFANGAILTATNVMLLRYVVDVVGIAAGVAGVIIGASKIYDAVIDPLIGTASDRTTGRWGRRRPYLLVGGVVSAIAFILLFVAPPPGGPVMQLVMFALVMLVNATGYALFSIPYLAMPAEMTTSPIERSRLMSYRVSGAALGQMLGTFVGPMLVTAGGGGQPGHSLMAVVLGAVILAVCLACFHLTRGARFTARTVDHSHSVADQFRTAITNRPFVLLILTKLSNLTASAVQSSITPFLFLQILHVSYSWMGFYFLARASAMLVSQPAWLALIRRIGKKTTYHVASVLYFVSILAWLLTGPGVALVTVLVLGFGLGAATGGVLLIGQALLPDTIDYDYRRTGLRREGAFAGIYIMVEKISSAAALSGVGIALGAAGYLAGAGAGTGQPPSAILAIWFCVLAPAGFQALASAILIFYRIDDEPPSATEGVGFLHPQRAG